MSRFRLKPKSPDHHEIVVGYDKPLKAFFCQAYGPEPEDPNEDWPPFFWAVRATASEAIEFIDQFADEKNEATTLVRKLVSEGLDPGPFWGSGLLFYDYTYDYEDYFERQGYIAREVKP